MGLCRPDAVRGPAIVALLALAAFAAGCQTARPIATHRLIAHQAMVDFTGLQSTTTVEPVKVICAPPRNWQAPQPQKTSLFTHQQWRAPSATTGVGVVYVHLPLPIGTKAVLWLAKQEYTKRADDGRLIGEWTDGLGRSWFEAENKKYHVRGYAVTQGFEAWIVYFGYKTAYPPNPGELSIAARCAEAVVPLTGDADKSPPDANAPKVVEAK